MNQLFAGQKKEAFERIQNMLSAKEDPLRILSAFINKFREIVLTQSLIASGMNQDGIQQYLNVKRGRAYYMLKNARTYPRPYVEKVLKQLETFDLKIKTGLMDKTLALELFIMGL
jgi:DNA polymerase-3 subunit delta